MKKRLLLNFVWLSIMAAVFSPNTSFGQCYDNDTSCYVIIKGYCFEGTCWAGDYMEVWQDTMLRATFTLGELESERIDTVWVCSGDSIRFVWYSGINDILSDYHYFYIYSLDGTPVVSHGYGSDYSNGQTIVTISGQCPSCPRPTNLVAEIGYDSLLLRWTPRGSESAWIVNVDSNVYTVFMPYCSVHNLSHGSKHTVTVRALCQENDTSSSIERTFATLPVRPVDSLPFFCNFETTKVRSKWYRFNGDFGPDHMQYQDKWVISQIPQDTTGHGWALYITDSSTKPNHHGPFSGSKPYSYAVLDLQRGEYNYSFEWKANGLDNQSGYQSYLRAAIIPDVILEPFESWRYNVLPSGEIALDGGRGLTGETQWQTMNGVFSIRYPGKYKMAFLWYTCDSLQPPAAVDNISVEAVGCAAPVDLICTDSTEQSLTIQWEPIGDESEWIIEYEEGNEIVDSTVYTIYGLTPNTIYNVSIRALCGNGDTSRALCGRYKTLPMSPDLVLPFYCDFEDSLINTLWVFNNGPQLNRWWVGTAANNTNDGNNALYISVDSGMTNTYSSATTNVYSYVFMTLDTGIYEYSYDWRCLASNHFTPYSNYMLAAVVPASTPTIARNQGSWTVSGFGAVSHPNGAEPLDGNMPLNGVTDWHYQSGIFSISDSGLYKLVFFWHNSGGTANQPPAAVDNIYVNRANCLPPNNLAVTADSNTLTLTWHPRGYEDRWMVKAGDFSAITTDTFYIFQGLIPGHQYRLGVKALCTETVSSMFAYINAYTGCGTVETMPYVEDFTGVNVNDPMWMHCWDTLNNGTELSGWRYASGYTNGMAAASYCFTYEPENDWLISPPIRLQNSFGYNLYWLASGNVYSSLGALDHLCHLTVVLSTSYGTDASSFTDTLFSDYITNAPTQYMVDLSAYNGNTVRIAFIHDSYATYLYIDDVIVEERPSCPPPTDIAVIRGTHSLDLSWSPDGSENQWEVSCGNQSTVVSSTNYTFNSLQPNTSYTVAVRAICGPGDTSVYLTSTATTLLHPAVDTLPYFCNFADSEAYNWDTLWNTHHLATGEAVWNSWYVGSAAYYGSEDTMGLYVSFDGGATNRYSIDNAIHTIYAFRTFNLQAGDYNCEFNWRNDNTQCRVYIVPADIVLQADRYPGYNGVLPFGSVLLASGLSNRPQWDCYYGEFTISTSGQYNLVFEWHNSYTNIGGQLGYFQPPAAIDNVKVRRNSCPILEQITVRNLSSNTIELDWNDTGASQWEIEYGQQGFQWGTGTRIFTSQHPCLLTGLDSLTRYDFWVRPICSEGDTGYRKKVEASTVFCDNSTFVSIGGTNDLIKTNVLSASKRCMLSEIIIDNPELYPEMNISGMQLYYDSDVLRENDTIVDIYLQPTTISSFATANGAVPLDGSTSVHVYHGSFSGFTQGWNTIIFDNEYLHNGNQNLLVIINDKTNVGDNLARFRGENCSEYKSVRYAKNNDINLYAPSGIDMNNYKERPLINFIGCFQTNCPRPENIVTTDVGYDHAIIVWDGNAPNYGVSVKDIDSTVWRQEIIVDTNCVTITGLHSNRTYQCCVRSKCGDGDNSSYVQLYITTDTLPCYAPVDFHRTVVGLQSATFDWTVSGDEELWRVHIWNTAFDSLYYTNNHPFTAYGLAASTQYYSEVIALCGNGDAESEPSDRLTFTTLTCPQVTGVTVSNVTSSSAIISWNHCAQSYQVQYGYENFLQDQGTTVDVNNAETFQIVGLEADENYSVFVRAKCEGNVYGLWSEQRNFSTSPAEIQDFDTQSDFLFQIYPNPSDGDVTIFLRADCDVVIDIVNPLGRIVYNNTVARGQNISLLHVNLPEGTFFVRACNDAANVVKKIVVK